MSETRGAIEIERSGTLTEDGDAFLVHMHVLPADSDEMAALRAFRDRAPSGIGCAGDWALMQAYLAQKRAILAAGISGYDYTVRKGRFIEAVMRRNAEG